MKKETLKHILFWVIIIALGFAIGSCSSRTKTVERDLHEVKIESSEKSERSEGTETTLKVDINTTVNDASKTVFVKKTFSPVDPTKPAIVRDSDGKKHEMLNSTFTEETTTEMKEMKTEKASSAAVFQNREVAEKKETKVGAGVTTVAQKVEVNRSGFNLWSWMWVLGIISIVFVLLYLNNRFSLIKRVTSFFSK